MNRKRRGVPESLVRGNRPNLGNSETKVSKITVKSAIFVGTIALYNDK